MQISTYNYIRLLVFHCLIGFLIFLVKDLSKIYSALIILIGFYIVIKNSNKNDEVLFVCAYLVGCEAFTRMTKGFPIYEFSKYMVVLFCLIGMIYSGFSKNAVPYWIFIILLIPGIIIATETLSFDNDLRKNISFNISGPLCIAISSIYNYNRKITFQQLNNLLLAIGLPIVTTITYLFFYTTDIKEMVTGTSSNSATSGGFGPNQVATVLGLGAFIFFSRLLFYSKNKWEYIINLTLLFNIGYRGLVTFSRGGMLTSAVMILILIIYLLIHLQSLGRFKLILMMIFSFFMFSFVWFYTNSQTNGMITNRYNNKDALGRDKGDMTTGRGEIANSEFRYFLENPFLGIGVAKSAEIRVEETGINIASHSEISRMLAEHGTLGIIDLLILFITPLILYLDNKQNIYVLCFVVFWLLTINHSAMRIAAPAFIYSLSLLKVQMNEEPKPTLYRKQTV